MEEFKKIVSVKINDFFEKVRNQITIDLMIEEFDILHEKMTIYLLELKDNYVTLSMYHQILYNYIPNADPHKLHKYKVQINKNKQNRWLIDDWFYRLQNNFEYATNHKDSLIMLFHIL